MAIRYALMSVLIGVVVLGLKFLAYHLTGSVALYSDALESIINVVAAGAALLALWVASKPADAQHPYGHQKAEYLSAVVEGGLIVIAAVSIIRSAAGELAVPQAIETSGPGLMASLAASALNAVWAGVLVRAGRRLRSPALRADGQHLFSDVVTGWRILDPLLALLVALNILWVGYKLVQSSVNGLLDEAAPEAVQRELKGLVSVHADGALEAHDFRTRHAGSVTFIDFHLVVPGDMSVQAAHEICDRLEAIIEAQRPGSQITIHVEPDSAAKHRGIVVV